MTTVIHHVDSYWAMVFAAAGLEEPHVWNYWLEPGEQLQVSCGDQDGAAVVAGDLAAFYCPADRLIVISEQFAETLSAGSIVGSTGRPTLIAPGDFSVAFMVAHEYAHAVQDHLGLLAMDLPSTAIELHADCWAGVWASHAYADGVLTEGSIIEGIQTAYLLGDESEHRGHGTPWERVGAFLLGFGVGTPTVCDAYLLDLY